MVNDDYLADFEKVNRLVLPLVYKDFLKNHNNGIVFDEGTILYSLGDIIEMNKAQSIQIYQPNYIAVGDNGGGFVFLMKQDVSSKSVYVVDMGDLDIDTCEYKTDNFDQWVDEHCLVPSFYSNEQLELVDVYLIKLPDNGLSGLLDIKKAFSLTLSAKELLLISRNLPCKLISGINIAKARKRAKRIKSPDLFRFKNHEE